jgi:pyridoxal phosphate enzyme (YggS family)
VISANGHEDHLALRNRIDAIEARVRNAALAADRDPTAVTITAVSKTFSRELVDQVYAIGLSNFGESRVQEAREKFAGELPADLRLSMIGQLQTNKVRQALQVFDRIESVDRPSLIETMEREAARVDTRFSVLLQVNIGREPQKSGCLPEDATDLARAIEGSPHLRLDGLMGIAPLVDSQEKARPYFRSLRELRDQLRDDVVGADLGVLSMGMSGDFEAAIAEGATHVRIGSAIFGGR